MLAKPISRRRFAGLLGAGIASAAATRGHASIPSQTNFLMTGLGQDVGPVVEALRERRVEVGRRFAALPTHLRVTVGTRSQMERFLSALDEVLAK